MHYPKVGSVWKRRSNYSPWLCTVLEVFPLENKLEYRRDIDGVVCYATFPEFRGWYASL